MSQHHDRSQTWPAGTLASMPWRIGRKVTRNVYAQVSRAASDNDVLIGQMDTGELAEAVVRAHNSALGH